MKTPSTSSIGITIKKPLVREPRWKIIALMLLSCAVTASVPKYPLNIWPASEPTLEGVDLGPSVRYCQEESYFNSTSMQHMCCYGGVWRTCYPHVRVDTYVPDHPIITINDVKVMHCADLACTIITGGY